MRGLLITALLTAGAFATPLGKRDVVTEVDVIVETVTVTVGGPEPTTSSSTHPVVTVTQYQGYGESRPASWSWNTYWWHRHDSSSTTAEPTSTSVAVAAVEQSSSTPAPAAPSTSAVKPSTTAPTSTEASSSATDTDTAALPTGTDYQSLVLYHTNIHRFNHSAPPVSWDDDLAETALMIANTCNYNHNLSAAAGPYGAASTGAEPYGQNIAAGYDAAGIGGTISNLFYNGEVNSFLPSYYGMANPPNFDAWGHFGQLVWVATNRVGCATVDCTGGLANFGDIDPFFTVCNYYPEGNMGGEYGTNILPSKNEPTVTGSTG